MNIRRIIFLFLMMFWMAGIFAFSSRPGAVSSEDSYFAGAIVGEIFIPGFSDWSESEQHEFAEKIDHSVRKTAHAVEYAVLALLTAGACFPVRKALSEEEQTVALDLDTVKGYRLYRTILCAWGIVVVYAATDEFHQLFVPGRSGQISDVVLDSAGAMAGLMILTAVIKIRRKYKKCRKVK